MTLHAAGTRRRCREDSTLRDFPFRLSFCHAGAIVPSAAIIDANSLASRRVAGAECHGADAMVLAARSGSSTSSQSKEAFILLKQWQLSLLIFRSFGQLCGFWWQGPSVCPIIQIAAAARARSPTAHHSTIEPYPPHWLQLNDPTEATSRS